MRSGSLRRRVVRFGDYEADLLAGRLSKRGIRIKLPDQSFEVLATLLEHAGEVVTREDLQTRLWPERVFLDFENNLNTVVARLRDAINDSAEHPRFIETLPKRGYRFVAGIFEPPQSADMAAPPRVKLVVLPFVNLSGDPAQEYFSDAVTDEIITELACVSPAQFAVIARTTAMHYKGNRKDVAQIGRELDVAYVVEGGVRRTEEQVALNVQLVRTSDQTHLFARRYEAALRDIFETEASIAEDIASHIDLPRIAGEVQIRSTSARARRKPTANFSAYNEYVLGRYLLERLTPEAMAGAKQHFEEALRLDAEFALAHNALADFYSRLGYVGYMRPKDAYSIGIKFAQRAVELDDTLAEPHAALAAYYKQLDYDWPAARREMARALELNRMSPFVRFSHAVNLLMPQNRLDEAIAEIECSLESDPLAATTRMWLGIMLLLARKYDSAIDEARKLLEIESASCWPHFISGVAYRQKHFEKSVVTRRKTAEDLTAPDFAEEAIAGHLRAIELAPGSDYFLGWFGLALGICGRKTEARGVMERLQRSECYILPTSFAHIYLGLGEFDAAFEWFDRAVEERDQTMMPILSYAHFDPIRDDPRFALLLRKMNLA